MTILSKLNSYMGLADTDYLASRLLILSGLPLQGLAKASEAIEKQFKLFFAIFERIQKGREISQRELRQYGHNLLDQLNSYNQLIPQEYRLGEDWKELMVMLKDSYNLRYPEHWKEVHLPIELSKLDQAYTYLRNNNVNNLPQEIRSRGESFGTFLGDIWTEDYILRIEKMGLKTPYEILELNNNSYENLKIKADKSSRST